MRAIRIKNHCKQLKPLLLWSLFVIAATTCLTLPPPFNLLCALALVGSYTLLLAYIYWTRKIDDSLTKQNMISMVALFERLPYLDRRTLELHVHCAWGIDFKSHKDATQYVKGNTPMFLVCTGDCTGDRIYAINYFERPYYDQLDEAAGQTNEVRAKSIIQNHRAWISVDLMKPSDAIDDIDIEYARIGKLLNEIINHEALAILIPETMRLIPWSKSAEEMLTSDSPLNADVEPAPHVLQVDDRNPKLMRAVLQARRKFPQFVNAFERCMREEVPPGSLQDFSIKSPITVGQNTEFIWCNVTAIENGVVYGKLCNEPVSLKGLSAGSLVRVRVSELNDWLYIDNGEIKGGFTIKILKNLRYRKKAN